MGKFQRRLLYRKILKKGFTRIISTGRKDTKHIDFGILRLSGNQNFENKSNTYETVLIILGGRCNIEVGEKAFKNVGRRKNVFEGKAYAVYVPPGLKFKIHAVTDEIEAAICAVRSKVKSAPVLITPDMVRRRIVGRHNWRRDVYDIIYEATAGDKILVGETVNPPGNWSSMPPHRHENDNMPYESKHEETYFFKIAPKQGFGIQWVYTDDFSIDEVYVLRNNDLVVIPRGYHPVAAAPGYKVYYLWVLAGDNRLLKPKDDPKHSWIKKEV